MRIAQTAALVIAVATFGVGCGNSTRSVGAGGSQGSVAAVPDLVARGRPPIPDLPVPIGFKLDENKSVDYAVAGARFVNHKYKGNADKFEVKRFYERQMPISRWTLTTAMFASGDVVLDFEKDVERCRVTITKGSLFHRIYVHVRLWTSGPIQVAGKEG